MCAGVGEAANLTVKRGQTPDAPSLIANWQHPVQPANIALQCPLRYLISVHDSDRGVFAIQHHIANSLLIKIQYIWKVAMN